MCRLVWLLMVLVLLGAACDPSSEAERAAQEAAREEERNYVEPPAEEEEAAAESTDASQPGSGDLAEADESSSSPDGKVERAPSEPTAMFLAEGGTLDGLLTLNSVQKEQTYDGAFNLTTVLPFNSSQDEAESYRETVRRAVEKTDLVREILDSDVFVLSQQNPESPQNTFGLGVTLQDDSTRFVTAGGDGFFELYVLQPFPCDGFPTECQEVFFGGWTLGWGTSVDTDQLIEAALKGLSPGDSFVTDAFWTNTIEGTVTALGPELIKNLDSGIFPDGTMGIKVDLGQAAPFADTVYIKTVGIAVRDDAGGFYTGSLGSIDGNLTGNGLCLLGDNCPPDQSWPGFDVVVNDDGVIVFSFDPLDGPLTVAAEVTTTDGPDPDSTSMTSSYLNGQQIPFGTGRLNN